MKQLLIKHLPPGCFCVSASAPHEQNYSLRTPNKAHLILTSQQDRSNSFKCNERRKRLLMNLSIPGVLLNAVYRGWSGCAVVHDDRLASVRGIRGPILRRVVGVSVRSPRVENVVVSSVDHGTALAGCPLETAHTWGANHWQGLGLQVYRAGGARGWKGNHWWDMCKDHQSLCSTLAVRHVKTSPETQTRSCSFTLSKISNLEEINDKQKRWPVVPQVRGPLVG